MDTTSLACDKHELYLRGAFDDIRNMTIWTCNKKVDIELEFDVPHGLSLYNVAVNGNSKWRGKVLVLSD